MCWSAMARKDDPVFNVRFVQFVECQPCLWNYTHPGYSKKEEVQRAWQQVANEIKDTVRNCRERWRTIRSSFLRSLKLARTQTGRGKRKYYLSKYLQFLIPYTKSHSNGKMGSGTGTGSGSGTGSSPGIPSITTSPAGMVLRKPVSLQEQQKHGQKEEHNQEEELEREQKAEQDPDPDPDQTKESGGEAEEEQAGMPLEVELEDGDKEKEPPPPHLRVIKWEPTSPQNPMHHQDRILTHQSLVAVPCNNMDWTDVAQWLRSNSSNNNNNNNNNNSTTKISTPPPPPPATPALSAGGGGGGGGGGAGAIPLSIAPPDADYFFLVSLHPYLKEMSGKQCRRFRQKVVALIDNVLDNTDT